MTSVDLDLLRAQVHAGFCGPIDIRAVPAGIAVSAGFIDSSGDPIGFYIVQDGDHLRIEDDGSYLSELVARDIPIDQGQRAALLNAILEQGSAHWDRDTLEIRTAAFPMADLPRRVVQFLSALIRTRDLELLTRETVRSTFRDDAIALIRASFESVAIVQEDAPPGPDFLEFPSDIVIRPVPSNSPHLTHTGAIYIINSNDKLNEALLLQTEAAQMGSDQPVVIGLIEDAELAGLSKRRFQRAQNRSLTMPIFRGDEAAAMGAIGRRLGMRPSPFDQLIKLRGANG